MPIAANCPGAMNLIQATPKDQMQTSNDAAQGQGIDIHAAMETDKFDELEVSEREIANRLKHLESVAADNWLQSAYNGETPTVMREQRMWIRDRKTFKLLASAKIDYGNKLATTILLLDYKTGFLDPVPSEVNWQLKTQAVAAWHEYPELVHVRAGIVASRLRDKLDQADYSLEGLRGAEWEIMRVIEKTKEPDAQTVPGMHCRYCPAKAFCRSHAAWLAVDTLPLADASDELSLYKAVGALSPSAVGKIYRKKRMLEILLLAINTRMQKMPEKDLKAIGFQRKAGASRRYIIDQSKIVEALTGGETPLISKEDLLGYFSVKIGDLDALVEDLFPGIAKKEIEAKVSELVGSAIEKRPNKASITPI